MTEVTNLTAQTLTPGQSVTFDSLLLKTGQGECCKTGTATRILTPPRLRYCGVYELGFHGNIASALASNAVQIAITVDGVPLPETTMISVPATANTEFNSVSATTLVSNACGETPVIRVTNTGTVTVLVAANSALRIVRRS